METDGPLICDQLPNAGVALFADKVTEFTSHTSWSVPALAITGKLFTITVSVSELERQMPLLVVQIKL